MNGKKTARAGARSEIAHWARSSQTSIQTERKDGAHRPDGLPLPDSDLESITLTSLSISLIALKSEMQQALVAMF